MRIVKDYEDIELRIECDEAPSQEKEKSEDIPANGYSLAHPPIASFALTAVDKPDVTSMYSAAPDPKAALFSNPPSLRQSAADVSDPLPGDKEQKSENGSDSDDEGLPEFPQPPQFEESRVSFERGKERLAGQGMRRPSPEQGKRAPDRPEFPSDPASDGSHNREDPGVGKMSQADPSDFGLGAKDSTRKSREERIRARKLRDLQRTRNNIDEVIERHIEAENPVEKAMSSGHLLLIASKGQSQAKAETEEKTASLEKIDPYDGSHDQYLLTDTSSSTITPGYSIGYTPVSSRISLTPIMLVAEQIPMPKPKQAKKPARLVLRERRTSKTLAVAVHEAAEYAAESAPVASSGSGIGAGHEHPIMEDMVPPRNSSQNYVWYSEPEEALERKGEVKHLSAPAIIPTAQTPTTAASATETGTVPGLNHRHTTSHASRASIASNLLSSASISANRESRLETRVETLERENRLLEAALMAVLKSGGCLNKCACKLRSAGDSLREGVVRTGAAESGSGSDRQNRESVESI
ncbi:hypothetical protein K432DRAFT_383713 [Lepidopterella palustris CBS 459.81]|uniref:Uncharacterized protein n=1 Tax=Lepidopterella palustris CBS 459.81 TaxID=1314670 RepID=A0A8E2E749_9PEZI|nr:hypothetical protein K432DRAFT_383713 [Lepidopterella palustris CBS 459.81]